jgi:hypothetical protein
MQAKVDEIAGGVYRISAYVPDIAPPGRDPNPWFLLNSQLLSMI